MESLNKHYGGTVHYQIAEVQAQLGNTDAAIAALEEAWLGRDSGLTSMQVDPFLDPIRNDARFSAIVRRAFG